MNTEQFAGIAVVSQNEGAKLGKVQSALFDPATLHLRAFQIKGDGQTFLVPFDRVRSIGADAIMVESSQATQIASTGGDFDDLVEFAALKKLKVIDAAGTFLGTISDLELDPKTGHALRMIIHKGGILGFGGETTTVDAAAMSSVGSELITITTAEATSGI